MIMKIFDILLEIIVKYYEVIMMEYSDEFLLDELRRFVEENGRNPTCRDFMNNENYPDMHIYFNRFRSWNNAFNLAGLKVNQTWNKLTGNECCTKCGSDYTSSGWIHKDGEVICDKCYHGDRNYFYGKLNPNSHLGLGIISEYIVYEVLGDCKKCNTEDNFNSDYDLISDKYGTINVKSSKLREKNKYSYCWPFTKSKNAKIPDNYVCVGFNNDRTEISKVWIIPRTSKLLKISGISITNSETGLKRAQWYEVNVIPYNNIYQNLDVTTLSEFQYFNTAEEYNANVASTN